MRAREAMSYLDYRRLVELEAELVDLARLEGDTRSAEGHAARVRRYEKLLARQKAKRPPKTEGAQCRFS
jgi:hypothetical protein